MYHQIDTPPARGTPMRGLVVAPSTFSWQMGMLRLLGYRGVSMTELMPYLRGERTGKVVGITFDDGYRNNLEHALPVLQRFGFSATCYAVSRLAGRDNAWDAKQGVPSKPLMNADELRRWVAGGMEVGAHTRDHADLTTLDADTARDQITGCKRDLEDLVGAPVRHFCYPYGRFLPQHVVWAREAGYQSATTVNRGRAQPFADPFADPFTLPRVLVSRSTHPGYFFLKLQTRYEDRRGH